ncbi:MAG: hypothetical protein U0M10_06100 [Oscillospiraceae bacterium]|nr:hypothetical protein [Oscillospiraceae bacterium]
MNIIDFRKICFDKHNRAYFLRVQPDDLKVTLSQIFYVLSNLSWISNFDEDYIRESFQERAKATLADIYAKITTSSTDEVSSDAGEYVVSELAREAIVDKLGYLDIPLAELYNSANGISRYPSLSTIASRASSDTTYSPASEDTSSDEEVVIFA